MNWMTVESRPFVVSYFLSPPELCYTNFTVLISHILVLVKEICRTLSQQDPDKALCKKGY